MRRTLLLLFIALFSVVVILFGAYLAVQRKSKRTSSAPVSSTRFICPVPKEYCQQGKIITVKGQYAGVGYAVPPGATLYAVFAGGLRPGWAVSSTSREPLIILENKKMKMEAVYRITGPSFTRYNVAGAGEKIAEAQEARLIGSDFNIVIYIRRTDAKSKPVMPVQPADFMTL